MSSGGVFIPHFVRPVADSAGEILPKRTGSAKAKTNGGGKVAAGQSAMAVVFHQVNHDIKDMYLFFFLLPLYCKFKFEQKVALVRFVEI